MAIEPNSLLTFSISPDQPDQTAVRLDKFLSSQITDYSRSFLTRLIENSCVTINGKLVTKPSTLLKANDHIEMQFVRKDVAKQVAEFDPTVSIDILYEDDNFLVINKPAYFTIHAPNSNSMEFTLADWLTHHYKEILAVGHVERPGIVHRLDKDTSGIVVAARTNYAHGQFTNMFKQRTIHKTYWAIVQGHPDKQGTIDLSIGRSLSNKTKMATFNPNTYNSKYIKMRSALSHYKVLEYFKNETLIEVKPVTGRTHQIRVHCAAIGHPIIGDSVYGTASSLIDRQALHAHSISFELDNKNYSFSAELPHDFNLLLQQLRKINS